MTLDHAVVVKLDLPATYTYLNVLSGCIAEILEHVEFGQDRATTVYNLQLAAHEVCTNIVGHAYPDTYGGRITIELTIANEPPGMIIDLRDTGRAFDPADVSQPTLEQPQVHGYGLFIVQQLMDEVVYTPEAQGNHWRLVKYLS